MRIVLWLVLLVSVATVLTGCPALSGLLGGGSNKGGSGNSGGGENRRDEREDDDEQDEKDESAIPRLHWSVAAAWDDVPAPGDVCACG